MKLGFLTAPFPDTPLMEVADWAAATGFEVLEIACWPKTTGPTRRYAGTSHIDVADLSAGQARDLRAEIEAKGPDHLWPGLLPEPAPPGRGAPGDGHRPSQAGHRGRREDGPAPGQHVHGRGRGANQDQNWERALQIWPDIVKFAQDHGRKITLENCPMLFSYDEWPGGHNIATSPRMWRRILEQWGGTIGLNFDPSHLILQMIDMRRFLKEFGPHVLHYQAKDLMIDRDGLYENGVFSWVWAGRSRASRVSARWTGASSTASSIGRATRATASSNTKTVASKVLMRRSSKASCIARDVLRPYCH